MTKSPIEWTEETWNPIVGCTIVSPGCTNCYAMKMANRLQAMGVAQYQGMIKTSRGGPVWTGKMALAEKALLAPLKRRKPTMYFVNSMGDLFHEDVPDDWIDRVFAIMALCPQHTFQVLTKRSKRMREYFNNDPFNRIVLGMMQHTSQGYPTVKETMQLHKMPYVQPTSRDDWWPLPNVWLGVSAEDQTRADERIPDLLETPAAIRFVSAEPLLGPVDLSKYLPRLDVEKCGLLDDPLAASMLARSIQQGTGWGPMTVGLDWIITGGESGPNARPMHPDWARSIRDQCAGAGVAFFFKQWGEWSPCILEDDGFGDAAAAYPTEGCCNPESHNNEQHAVFWEDGKLKSWAVVNNLPAIGARRIGKARAGRLLDGRNHDDMPEVG